MLRRLIWRCLSLFPPGHPRITSILFSSLFPPVPGMLRFSLGWICLDETELHGKEQPQAAWCETIIETDHSLVPIGKPRWGRHGWSPGSHRTSSTTGAGRKSVVRTRRMRRKTWRLLHGCRIRMGQITNEFLYGGEETKWTGKAKNQTRTRK